MLRPRIPLSQFAFSAPKHAVRRRPHRLASTASTTPRPSATPSKRRLFRASYLWYGLVLLAGSSAGLTVRNFVAPLTLPPPGTREDELALAALTSDIEGLDIVKYMRAQGYHLHDDTPISRAEQPDAKTVHKGWMELDIKSYIGEAGEEAGTQTRTLTGASMAGARGLGVQRAFWNSETGEMVAVVWIGGALSGWPGLAHGGAIATIFQDCMAKMVAGPGASIDSVAGPSSMSVTYALPTYSTNFYILRANYSKPDRPQTEPPSDSDPTPAKSWLPWWKDFTKKAPSVEEKKAVEIIGTLEDTEGKLCVRAKGTFPASA